MTKKIKKLIKKSYGSRDKQGFTLVELIIVIAIIAVLAVSAFMMLTKWLGNSRDSRRIADANTIQSALNIHMGDLDNSAGLLPLPSNSVELSASGTVIGYQGNFDASVIEQMDNLQKVPLDPDENYYTYYVSEDRKKFQILVYLENDNELVGNIYNMAKAEYEGRYEKSFGYDLGVFTDTNNVPVQNLGLTGIDLTTTTNSYNVIFKNQTIKEVNGETALSTVIVYQELPELIEYDRSVLAYWDMETTLEDGRLEDLSPNNNHGEGTGGVIIGGVDGVKGKATLFNETGVLQQIIVPDDSSLDVTSNEVTIALWFKLSVEPTATRAKYPILLIKRPRLVGGYAAHFIRTDGSVIMQYCSTGTSVPIRTDITLEKDRWYFYTGVKTQDTLSVYIDGQLIASTPTNGSMKASTGELLKIGDSFQGVIDEIRLYDRPLSQAEIDALKE